MNSKDAAAAPAETNDYIIVIDLGFGNDLVNDRNSAEIRFVDGSPESVSIDGGEPLPAAFISQIHRSIMHGAGPSFAGPQPSDVQQAGGPTTYDRRRRGPFQQY